MPDSSGRQLCSLARASAGWAARLASTCSGCPTPRSNPSAGAALGSVSCTISPRRTGIEPLPFGHSARATGTSSLHLPMARCCSARSQRHGACGCARAQPSRPRTAPQRPSAVAAAHTRKTSFKHARRLAARLAGARTTRPSPQSDPSGAAALARSISENRVDARANNPALGAGCVRRERTRDGTAQHGVRRDELQMTEMQVFVRNRLGVHPPHEHPHGARRGVEHHRVPC